MKASSEEPTVKRAMKVALANMASNTAMHGLPNVTNRRSMVRKIFWGLVVVLALGK